jgi:hypothetical protein
MYNFTINTAEVVRKVKKVEAGTEYAFFYPLKDGKELVFATLETDGEWNEEREEQMLFSLDQKYKQYISK